MDHARVRQRLLQALEHERGAVKIYQAALKCAVNEELKEAWERFLQETERHVDVLHDALLRLGLDPAEETPGRKITRDRAAALVAAVESALGAGDRAQAQCVACESVVVAELVGHSNWEIVGEVARRASGPDGRALKGALAQVEDEQDEHYYQSKGWLRELSLELLGVRAVLPPPAERSRAKSAMRAARARKAG